MTIPGVAVVFHQSLWRRTAVWHTFGRMTTTSTGNRHRKENRTTCGKVFAEATWTDGRDDYSSYETATTMSPRVAAKLGPMCKNCEQRSAT